MIRLDETYGKALVPDTVDNCMEYETLGARTSDTYDNIEMQPRTVEVDANVQRGGNVRCDILSIGRTKKRVCIGIIVAVITLLVVALAVMVYVFLSSKPQGGSCNTLTNIRNGQVVKSTGSRHGDTLEIQCDNNSKLNGPNTITCLSSGIWSADAQCVPNNCGGFQLKQNMIAESDIARSTVGSIIILSCTEGFTLSGNESIICQTDEMWSETPTCEPVDCELPRDVTNSKQLGPEKTTYNNSFTVECNYGYSLIGSEKVTCNIDGQWSDLPVCEIVSCGIPNIPTHASITNMTGTSFQSTVTMKCDEGYSMYGNAVISCTSSGNWSTNPTCGQLAVDCYDIYKNNIGNTSGVYSVKLWKTKQIIDVYCDMDTYPYGWTVFQKRFNGSVNFYRNLSEYTNGFGKLQGEFWLGLRYIEEMTSQYESELRLDVTAANNSHAYEAFQDFSLSKCPNFNLHLGTQTKQLSDSEYGFSHSNGFGFSTFDHDKDAVSEHCAELQRGGWWYVDCSQVNLNGLYLSPPGAISTDYSGWAGFIHYPWNGKATLKSSQMMFRKHS